MTSQWFLLILLCYIAYTAKYLTYLLMSTEVIQIWEFDNLHMTQCAKIIVGFMAYVGNVFIQRLQTFFLKFSPRFNVFNVFFYIFISTFITSMIKTTQPRITRSLPSDLRRTQVSRSVKLFQKFKIGHWAKLTRSIDEARMFQFLCGIRHLTFQNNDPIRWQSRLLK